jgi:tetratricopeptide (TPR) repeat protein
MSVDEDYRVAPSISLCLIVKNEAHNLTRCLSSAQKYVDEIVVVDTGSDDQTVTIAQQFGAKVGHFQWCNDFAAARNYTISQACKDWILFLDADEELVIDSTCPPNMIKDQLTAQPDVIAYHLPLFEATESDTELQTIRLFRNRADLRYIGHFHEYIDVRQQLVSVISSITGLKIRHYGYSDVEIARQKCLHRNIPLLEQVRKEDGLTLTQLYALAEMYDDVDQSQEAQDCYAEVFERLSPYILDGKPPSDFPIIPSVLFTLGCISLKERDYETVSLLCQRGLQWCPNHPPLNYLAGKTLNILGFPLGAIPYFEYCLELGHNQQYYQEGEPCKRSFMTSSPAYELGCSFLELNQHQKAQKMLEMALDFDPHHESAQIALRQLKNID